MSTFNQPGRTRVLSRKKAWFLALPAGAQALLIAGMVIVVFLGATPAVVVVADRAFNISLASALPWPIKSIAGAMGDAAARPGSEPGSSRQAGIGDHGPAIAAILPGVSPSAHPSGRGPGNGSTSAAGPTPTATSSGAGPSSSPSALPSGSPSNKATPESNAGKVSITVVPRRAVFDLANLAPGDLSTAEVKVTNTGNLTARYALAVASTGRLGTVLGLQARTGVSSCTVANYGHSGQPLTSTGGNGYATLSGAGFALGSTGAAVLEPGESQTLCLAVRLDPTAGNSAQGLSSDAVLDFTAEQIH